jgi:hypothetical protein
LRCQIIELGPSIRASFHDPLEYLCSEPPGSLDHNLPFSGSDGPTASTMNPSPRMNFHSGQQPPEKDNFVLQGNEEHQWSGFQPRSSAGAFTSNRELNYQAQISSKNTNVAEDHWNRPSHPGVPNARQCLQPSHAVQPVPPQTPNNSESIIAQSRIDNRPTSSRQRSFSDSAFFSLPSSGQGALEGHLHRSSMGSMGSIGSMTSPCPNPKDAPCQAQDSSKAPLEDAYGEGYESCMNENLGSYFQEPPWSSSNDFTNQDNQDENFPRTDGSQ